MPAGCTGFIVTSKRFAPHLRPGEIAGADPSDKEPVSGELSVVGINGALSILKDMARKAELENTARTT